MGIIVVLCRKEKVRTGLAKMSSHDRVSLGLIHPWIVTACPGVRGIFILSLIGDDMVIASDTDILK